MPGDSQRPVPNWVEVEWTVEPHSKEHSEIYSRRDIYSAVWINDHKEYQSRLKTIVQRVDLTTILTPEIVARARKNPKTTNIKLKVIFRDGQVSITAENEVWR
jgi:hypothetical protein